MATATALETDPIALNLGPVAAALIRALAKLPVAAPVDRLAVAVGRPPDAVEDALADLEAAGLVQSWDEAPGGPCVALSPLAASRLGLGIGDGRWCPAGQVPRERSKPRVVAPASDVVSDDVRGGAIAWLANRADPRAIDPARSLAWAEADEAARTKPRRRGERVDWKTYVSPLVPPRFLLGLRPPWSARPVEGTCPGCHGRPLGASEMCLRCDRWGLDHLLPPRKRPAPKVTREGKLLGGGLGRLSGPPDRTNFTPRKGPRP